MADTDSPSPRSDFQAVPLEPRSTVTDDDLIGSLTMC